MSKVYRSRVRRVERFLRSQEYSSALLMSSAPPQRRSRDTFFPYRQNSNFYYLTGSKAQDWVLLVSTEEDAPLLFAPPRDKTKELWEGTPPNAATYARSLGAKLVRTKTPFHTVQKHLNGVDQLFFQNTEGSVAWDIARSKIAVPSYKRGNYPLRFLHADVILEPMRLIKSAEEARLIREAAKVTNQALFDVIPYVRAGTKEYQITAALNHSFARDGCCPAFNTISATGPSAATLHYEHQNRALRNGDLLLIDLGAERDMYAADITRVLPVGGRFGDLEHDLYQCVLEAQLKAIAKIKAGVRLQSVYRAAAKALTEGLVEFKVLRGPVSELLGKRAFAPYFPHGVCHGLGLDVHDIGRLRGNLHPKLERGMVITVEPGLYFPKKIRKIPACGIRIEDDVQVTATGARVLSSGFPKDPIEIEALFEQ